MFDLFGSFHQTIDMDAEEEVKKVKIHLEVKDKDVTSKTEKENHSTEKEKMVTPDTQEDVDKEPKKMVFPINLKSLLAVMVLSILEFLVVYSVCACVVKKKLHGLEILGLKECLCDFLQFLIDKIDDALLELEGENEPENVACFMLLGVLFLLISWIVINVVQFQFRSKSTFSDFKDTPALAEKVDEPKSEFNFGGLAVHTPIPTLSSIPEPSTLQASVPTFSPEPESSTLEIQAPIPSLSSLSMGSNGDPKHSEIQEMMSHEDVVKAMKLWNGTPDTDQSQSDPSEPRRSINGDPGPHPILLETDLPGAEASHPKNALNNQKPDDNDMFFLNVDVHKID